MSPRSVPALAEVVAEDFDGCRPTGLGAVAARRHTAGRPIWRAIGDIVRGCARPRLGPWPASRDLKETCHPGPPAPPRPGPPNRPGAARAAQGGEVAGSAARRWHPTLAVTSLLGAGVSVLVWVTAALTMADKGLDVTDEGFYLLSYRWWDTSLRNFTAAQYVYGPIFELLGFDIVRLRYFRVVTVLAAAGSSAGRSSDGSEPARVVVLGVGGSGSHGGGRQRRDDVQWLPLSQDPTTSPG